MFFTTEAALGVVQLFLTAMNRGVNSFLLILISAVLTPDFSQVKKRYSIYPLTVLTVCSSRLKSYRVGVIILFPGLKIGAICYSLRELNKQPFFFPQILIVIFSRT
jgi:hypothetical protein